MISTARDFFSEQYTTLYFGEISDLKNIDTRAKLKSKNAKQFKDMRFDITLSPYAHDLLINFLESNELFTILSILNRYVTITVSEEVQPLQPALLTHENSILLKNIPLSLSLEIPKKEQKIPLPKMKPKINESLLDAANPTII